MALTYELRRECLNDVADTADRWQIEGGKVFDRAGKHVANYSSLRRVVSEQQSPAQLWLTLFFLGWRPAENMTLHGAGDVDSGGETGSVSAASPAFAAHVGDRFRRVVNTLTVG